MRFDKKMVKNTNDLPIDFLFYIWYTVYSDKK